MSTDRPGDLERFAVDVALYAAWTTQLWNPADPDYGFVEYFEAAAARNLSLLHGLEGLAEDVDRRGILPATDGDQARLVTDGGQPADDVHWIRPESLAKFDMVAATLLDRLADADGTATLDDLCRGDFETGAATSRIQTLFEHDVVDYELDQDDTGATEIELAHDTIRVMPIVVDGERPTLRDVLKESVGDVPKGVLEDV